jgi:SMI1 / KNR4 family (SUKH-1)
VVDQTLIERIGAYAVTRTTPLPFAIASEDAIEKAERSLGFSIPALLKACYLKVGNGGFGPGYGLIGVEHGYASDFGNLVETHEVLKQDQATEGREWPDGLLPFSEWGCNIFSCVDCHDTQHRVYTFEDFAVHPQGYNLDKFFELWMSGVDILSYEPAEVESVEILNPFTGKKQIVSKRRRR